MRVPSQVGRSRRVRRRAERGATTVFVAVSIIGLLAMAAFSFDFGRMYMERAELQAGADAIALAIATDCAAGRCDAGYDATAVAQVYADGNASDGAAWVRQVDIDNDANTVTVLTGSKDTEGNHDFRTMFAPVIGFNDVEIGARAVAAWGSPNGQTTAPLIFSECEWRTFAGMVPGGFLHDKADIPFTGSYDHKGKLATIYFHGQQPSNCPSHSSGQDLPGGFGWLDTSGNGCSVDTLIDEEVAVDPGSSPSNGCSPQDLAGMVETVQMIPYFDEIKDSGNNARYRILGYGALYVTGYYFGGQYRGHSLIDGQRPCSGNDRCIQGYLLSNWNVPPSGGGGGDTNLGVSSIGLIG